jgi:glycosyltransferase involved in cell wall biosynthesis
MQRISLVIATIGRVGELDALFRSISVQAYPLLECIVIDQNEDDRLGKTLDSWSGALSIRRLRSAPGLSRARNIGLQYAAGDIVAFPDDDCWYAMSLLREVARWFEDHPDYGILTVGAQDQAGVSSGNRWIQSHCEIEPINAFRTTFSSTIFVRRSAAVQSIRFDESLGVGSGTAYSCGEETDYILALLKKGERGYFDRSLHIHHPKRDMLSGQVDRARATSYGRGMGYVLRKHSHPLLWVGFVAYDLLRSAAVAVKGDLKAASLSFHHGLGVASGYLADFSERSSLPK